MSYDSSFNTSRMEGVSKFQSARLQAFWEEMAGLMRGKPVELLSFDEIRDRLHLSDESYKGIQEIEIDKIAGSVGRYRDFTSSFLPRRGKMQERWSRVYAVANSMTGLPPIEVYQVGDVYFVRDGNHRVSVARQLKSKTIEAHVTELRSPICLQPGMSREDLDVASAYADFLNETKLKTTRPHHQSLQLSEPSRYGEMMEHIYLHKRILEQIEGRELMLNEAAAHWYDNVYRPAVTLIRKYSVLEQLPKPEDGTPRTEADLYLWLVSHLREVRNEMGQEAPTGYSDALVDFLSQKRVAVPKGLLVEDDGAAPITETQVMRALNRYDDYAPFSGNNYHNQRYSA